MTICFVDTDSDIKRSGTLHLTFLFGIKYAFCQNCFEPLWFVKHSKSLVYTTIQKFGVGKKFLCF